MIKKEEVKVGDIVDYETILYRVDELREKSVIVSALHHDWSPEEASYTELYWPEDDNYYE